MKALNRILGILVIAGCLAVFSGCGSCHSASATALPGLAVEAKESAKLKVFWVNLEPEDNGTVLSGAIRQTGASPSPTTGHVDVEIRKPDGSVVYHARSETLAVPRHIVGKGFKHKRFRIPVHATPDQLDPANTITLKTCTDSQCQIHPI